MGALEQLCQPQLLPGPGLRPGAADSGSGPAAHGSRGAARSWRSTARTPTAGPSTAASRTSVLRPGTALMCCGFTSFTSNPASSSTSHTGFQYTPVASIATAVTPSATSQPASSPSDASNVKNVRTSLRRDRPAPGVRTQAVTDRLCTSSAGTPLDQHLHRPPPSTDMDGPARAESRPRCISCSKQQSRTRITPHAMVLPGLRAPIPNGVTTDPPPTPPPRAADRKGRHRLV